MEAMKAMPDKAYELAIVDPPYGIGNFVPQNISKQGKQAGKEVCWNNDTPNNKYFSEITRVAKTQIIWGANYYNCFNKDGGAIVWHKGNINPIFSQCEIASISSQKRVDYIFINWQSGFHRNNIENVIHPCQKPVALYQWLLKNYAKPGDKILDTHGGSCSSAIACDIMGYDCDIWEIDADYYKAAVERFERHKQQTVLEFK
jgi:site-specific DNA-methyltransferase (adenine-specific)